MKQPHRLVTACASLALGLLLFGCSESASSTITLPDIPTVGLNVEYHTQEEIISYIRSSGADFYDTVRYDVTPVIPTQPGSLSQTTKDSALATLNNFRFIAGLSPVRWDASKDEEQQAACLLSAMNGSIGHTPSQPAGLSDELYQLGYTGAKTSNLGMGYGTLNLSIRGYMSDVDVSSVGHRRWCLNPSMKAVSMGAVSNPAARYRNFYSMYALDGSSGLGGGTVAWPAQNTPIEYFDSDAVWSLSLGEFVDASSVRVIVQRNDGRAWEFSSAKSDGYFAVDNTRYGQFGCIIFKPNVASYRDGDQFVVTVIMEGASNAIQYTVSFFRL